MISERYNNFALTINNVSVAYDDREDVFKLARSEEPINPFTIKSTENVVFFRLEDISAMIESLQEIRDRLNG